MKTLTLLLAPVLFLIVQCGNTDAAKQPRNSLEKPEFNSTSQRFFLDDANFNKEFGGSILVWGDDPDPSGIATINKLSSGMIKNGVAQLSYIEKEILPKRDEFNETFPKLREVMGQIIGKSYERDLNAAGTWFAGADGNGGLVAEVATNLGRRFQQQLSAAEIGQLKMNFAAYCEAKIWERAVASTFIKEEYRGRRPTPAAICEGYYLKEGLISTEAPQCQATQSEYRNYFSCLWHEGVLKTKLWNTRYFAGSDVVSALSHIDDATLVYNFSTVRTFASDFLRHKRNLKIKNPKDGSDIVVDLTFNPAQVPSPLAGLFKVKVNEIILKSESKEYLSNIGEVFFNTTRFDGDAKVYLTEANDTLRDNLGFLGMLSTDTYVNENKYNVVLQKQSAVVDLVRWKKEKQVEAGRRFPSIMAIPDSEDVVALRQKLVPLKNQLVSIGEATLSAAKELIADSTCATMRQQTLACEFLSLANQARDAVMPDDLTKAVLQSSIKLARSEKGGLLTAEVKLNKISPVLQRACTVVDESAGEQCLSSDRKLEFDASTGILTIETSVTDDPASFSLNESSRENYADQLWFSDLSQRRLKNAKFVFNASVSFVDEVLYILVGEVKIRDESGDIYAQGSIKLRDQFPYQEVEAKKFQKILEDLRKQL